MSLDWGEGGDIDSGGEDGYVRSDKDNGNVPNPLSTLQHHHHHQENHHHHHFLRLDLWGKGLATNFTKLNLG